MSQTWSHPPRYLRMYMLMQIFQSLRKTCTFQMRDTQCGVPASGYFMTEKINVCKGLKNVAFVPHITDREVGSYKDTSVYSYWRALMP